ncbi:hypothetical protein [Microtetraspora niveoalba]|uniref:hypothetical protein n=1 Tax=Microtetraspora niveoalba TaxID=46175 RepID=UPI000A830F7C|nr:hypothetical protein [Microtetraspora niveoalba]
MDELNLLERSLPDAPPPSAEVVERARARLSAARHEPGRPVETGRRGWLWGWSLGAATATVAVVMAAVTLVSGTTTVPAPVLAPPGANDALLELADRVARLPDDRGTYWHRPVLFSMLIRVRAGGQEFNVLSSRRFDTWQPREPRDLTHVQQQEEFTRPATPADERVWRAAGSPAVVEQVCQPEITHGCDKVRLRSTPSDCRYERAVVPGGVLLDPRWGPRTLADLDALPDDPVSLREKLRTYWKTIKFGRDKVKFETFLPEAAALLDMPVRPSVRAAVLRLLAGLPTTRVQNRAADPAGAGHRGHLHTADLRLLRRGGRGAGGERHDSRPGDRRRSGLRDRRDQERQGARQGGSPVLRGMGAGGRLDRRAPRAATELPGRRRAHPVGERPEPAPRAGADRRTPLAKSGGRCQRSGNPGGRDLTEHCACR